MTTGSVFLLIPILLKTIGQEMFGIMVIVNTLMGFSGMFAFGLGQATLKYVADYRETGQVEQIAEVVRTTLWVYCITGLIACLMIMMGAEWLAQTVFRVSVEQLQDAIFAIRAGGFGFLGFLVYGVAENAFKGFEQFQRPVIIRSVVRVLTFSGQIALALSGYGLATLVGLQVVLYLIGAVILFLCLKRELIPKLSFVPYISWSTLKLIFSYGFYTYLSGIGGMIRQNGDTLLVGALLGPSALAIYTIPIRLLSQVHALLSRAYGFLFPYVSKLYAKGDKSALARCYDQSNFQISAISVSIITPLAVFAYPILELWLGPDIAAQAGGLTQIMALRFAVFPLSIVNAYFMLGSGQVRLMSVITMVNAVVSLTIIGLSAYYFGLWGAGLAQLSVFIPIFINRFYIEKKVLGERDYLRILSIPLLAIIPLFFCYSNGFVSYNPEMYLLLFVWIPLLALGALSFVTAFHYCVRFLKARSLVTSS